MTANRFYPFGMERLLKAINSSRPSDEAVTAEEQNPRWRHRPKPEQCKSYVLAGPDICTPTGTLSRDFGTVTVVWGHDPTKPDARTYSALECKTRHPLEIDGNVVGSGKMYILRTADDVKVKARGGLKGLAPHYFMEPTALCDPLFGAALGYLGDAAEIPQGPVAAAINMRMQECLDRSKSTPWGVHLACLSDRVARCVPLTDGKGLYQGSAGQILLVQGSSRQGMSGFYPFGRKENLVWYGDCLFE
ncbi:MAG: hypothetical protein ACOCWQ_04585 [Nanoarchaeota archaeon]